MTKVMVNFIQDRSGSMSSVWNETLNGFKEFVKTLKENKDGTDYLFALTTFDTLIETPFLAQPISDISETALDAHGPRGSTALYDAVGATLKNTEGIAADKYITVIVTDGHENSSREWDKDALHKAVEERLARGNWTFTYLGTQPETWDDAGAFGISAASTQQYTGTMARAAYGAMGQSVNCFAASRHAGTRSLNAFMPDSVSSKSGMRKAPNKPNAKSTGRWR